MIRLVLAFILISRIAFGQSPHLEDFLSYKPDSVTKDTSLDLVEDSTFTHNYDFAYFAIMQRGGLEAWFCVEGTGNIAKQLSMMWVDSASLGHVVGQSRSCPPNTIGLLHLHPPGPEQCTFSPIDIITYHIEAYPYGFVVCKPGKKSLPTLVVWKRLSFDLLFSAIPDTGQVASKKNDDYTFVPEYRWLRGSRRPAKHVTH